MKFKLALYLKTLEYKDGHRLWLWSPKKLYVIFIFHFFIIILSLSYYYQFDQKTGITLFNGFKIELRLTLGQFKLVCPKSIYWCWKHLYQILVIPSYLVYTLLKIAHFTELKRWGKNQKGRLRLDERPMCLVTYLLWPSTRTHLL